MDLSRGFQLEDPPVAIRFGISTRQLRALLGPRLRRVSDSYYSLSCTSLGGLRHELGFHFANGLRELEFFRTSYPDQAASFDEFQRHFESAFGPPTETLPGSDGFPQYHWRLPGYEIIHCVYDRFGLEEHMRIRSTRPTLKRFWRIKSAFFIVLLVLFGVNAIAAWVINGMLAFGAQRADDPAYLDVMSWFASRPVRVSERFPTTHQLWNLIFALGVNAIVWAWLGSLVIAMVVEWIARRMVGARARATRDA